MGCFSSKEDGAGGGGPGGAYSSKRDGRTKSYKKPVYAAQEPMTREQLTQMREMFWDTQPHYGGEKVIWDALKAACEADMETAKLIIESAGIIVAAPDMTICYDERGAKYELPHYVLSDPTNLS